MGMRTGDLRILHEEKDGKSTIRVAACRHRGRRVRLLLSDGAVQSASYTDPALRNELIFPYMKELRWLHTLRPDAGKILLIGAGGFAWPKYVLAHYTACSIDAVELSGAVIRISREWFYLPQDPRLRVICGDAVQYLDTCREHYDLIICDAFRGHSPAGPVLAPRSLRKIRSLLGSRGIFAANIPTAQKGPFSLRGELVRRRLGRFFRHTLLLPCDEALRPREPQNCLLFASDSDLFTAAP